MWRRLANVSGLTFALFFLWKVLLLLLTAQPIPFNDAFFYDGAVVNYLLHGEYCNPSLAQALPISGTEVFAAYPPLYQLLLLAWMKCFGTSALAAMWLHAVLVGIFAWTVLTIFLRLKSSPATINFAGLFLFGITFHDRPDTLAHVLGALALRTGTRWIETGKSNSRHSWLAAFWLLLALCSSLQIGGIYLMWILTLLILARLAKATPFPWAPSVVFLSTVIGLVALVKFGFPHLWAGFREHVTETPSLTPWRLPAAMDLLKVIRTAPGILAGGALFGWLIVRGDISIRRETTSLSGLIAVSGLVAGFALVAACLTKITANTINIATYMQPLIVGCLLGALPMGFGPGRKGSDASNTSVGVAISFGMSRIIGSLFLGAALLSSVRAVGMTTWGVACAGDVSEREAIARVKAELDSLPTNSMVLVSSAFLYEAASHTNITWIHSDWPAATRVGDVVAIMRLKPVKLLLTQFDYYRRYQNNLEQLRVQPDGPAIQVEDTANVRPPDASRMLQKVVQHISWAPIIVTLDWSNSRSQTNEIHQAGEK